MENILDDSVPLPKKVLIVLLCISILFSIGLLAKIRIASKAAAEDFSNINLNIVQGNTLLAVSNPALPIKVQRVKMIVTAYSSDPLQTDDTPFITASGSKVKEGIVANNLLPFGTKIKIPEIYGDKIFVVEDRMNWKKGYYHIDIWFPDYWQAKSFGAKRTIVEILES